MKNPFTNSDPRDAIDGDFTAHELALANRNSGLPAEMLQSDITPIGMHYLLNHFDIPLIDEQTWQLRISGTKAGDKIMRLSDFDKYQRCELAVTLECAGNGRAELHPRPASMAWQKGAIGTAKWAGVRLKDVLADLGMGDDAYEVAFIGADHGADRAHVAPFARSIPAKDALHSDALLCTHMNDVPLPPQHGFPMRLIMPGWYGMASIKWLDEIRVLHQAFDGFHQIHGYRMRKNANDAGTPISTMNVNSAIVPPGIPDWFTRARLVKPGIVQLMGRAWSGNGARIAQVDISINEQIIKANVEDQKHKYGWTKWTADWRARAGEYRISSSARDEFGNIQPQTPQWNTGGFCNNAPAHIMVFVQK